MAKSTGAAESPPQQPAANKAVPGSEVAGLAQLLVSANWIADHLSKSISAQKPDLTLSDWMLLRTLDAEGPMAIPKAAHRVGVTRQRVHQQMGSLVASGLISSDAQDGKSRSLSISPAGHTVVAELEAGIRSALSESDGGPPTGAIQAASRNARRVAKAMAPRRNEQPERKGGRE